MRTLIITLTTLVSLAFVSDAQALSYLASEAGGRAVDIHGQPLAGVRVSAKHGASGSGFSRTTNGSGRYVLRGLRIGQGYIHTASKPGFRIVEAHGQRQILHRLTSFNPVMVPVAHDGCVDMAWTKARWRYTLPDGFAACPTD